MSAPAVLVSHCHPGLVPGSRLSGTSVARLPWTPEQVRGDNEESGEPARIAQCHCDDCRRATGSSFATNVFVSKEDLKVLQGTTKKFERMPPPPK